MQFNPTNTALDFFIQDLFNRYKASVPAVERITRAMIEQGIVGSQQEILNDHIAFRTLGLPNLGIASFEKIFLHHGFKKRDFYSFEEKKLNAWWYAPPADNYPRIFISELRVNELSPDAVAIIKKYTESITEDPVDQIDLNDGQAITEYLHRPLWSMPELDEYTRLMEESEYAAWVILNRYYLNHYTISVHNLGSGYNSLPNFNAFVESLGIKLNDAGGKIKTSADGLLCQSSTVAEWNEVEFPGGKKLSVAGSYVEFAERKVLPEFSHLPSSSIGPQHRREGFEAGNADKIFESTYSDQAGDKK